ncbi:phosphocholine-specific phospholipase C [Variovorax sp. PAMC26660]|uniref:phosphocholine-specific phospholipase C n=1 Tax=Variovorax sp. PAMC26660 TaxID=2762322 RepID=UPI00164D36C9|nr:phospholipase C, phosphocholine-specific [Variovorax sp. PAMC26660]QNK65095.1 phospholipase C, phosphocholine-specific [Variovorax sp. PAMC26660]
MTSRRKFLQRAASTTAAAVTLSALPLGIRRALAIPANNKTGTITDVEHIVILMQENRSFDHYFGTLQGVRGFGDPRPVALPNGKPVWYQPNGGGYVLPYHPDAGNLGSRFTSGLNHNWGDGHDAWNKGRYDGWVAAKSVRTMAYMTREDIPFHFALADAFTICDGYHCSLLGPTDPNRYYMFSGCCGNDGTNGATGGPDISNGETGNYSWTTYPERLEAANISWKVYQDIGLGLGGKAPAGQGWGWTQDKFIGNYGDNSLLYFKQYRAAKPGEPLHDKARTGTNIAVTKGSLFEQLKNDVASGNLPKVSWIAAPEAYTEHPDWPSNGGAWYIDQVLQALTSNADVWSKTVLLVTYDENDGWFDHMPPPFAPSSKNQGQSTVSIVNEYHTDGQPFGLGVRVPMLVVSPWSKGGWVDSQVFDHTSIIRFIEARFGVQEPNISPWRRAVCGDLSSAFNFANPDPVIPALSPTAGYVPPATNPGSFVSTVPAVQTLPRQEPGQRPARPVPYELFTHGRTDAATGRYWLDFGNTGSVAAVFQVYAGNRTDGPWVYTVEAGKKLSDYWSAVAYTQGIYDLSVYGANGFLRQFKGNVSTATTPGHANPEVAACYDVTRRNILLTLKNTGDTPCQVTVTHGYGNAAPRNFTLSAGASLDDYWDLGTSDGWYDLSITANTGDDFLRRFAGHVENGQPSKSDPKLDLAPPVMPPAAAPTLAALKNSIAAGSSIDFSYSISAASVSAKNWIGVFPASSTVPDQTGYRTYSIYGYATGASGQVTLKTTTLAAGSYKVWFLANDGYGVLAGPVAFSVT